MAGYTITPLDLGSARREKSFFTYMTDVGKPVDLAIISFLVQGAGHTILVDTGGSAVSATAPWHFPYQQSEQQTMTAQLAARDLRPEDVNLVIFTHLHWDHCYNVELFPKAHFLVRRREFDFACDPCPIQDRMYDAPSTGVKPPFMDLDFRFTADDQEILPGIRVIETPGHSPGHQSVVVETRRGKYIITGDITPLYENWERRIPNGMLTNLEACYRSFARLERAGGTMLASHDPLTLGRAVGAGGAERG